MATTPNPFAPARWPRGANRKSPLLARFCSKVHANDRGCWEIDCYHQPNGYAQISDGTRIQYAHRLAYELFVGPIPDGLHIDHLCRNRGCVRPYHLEAVTQAENNRRAAHRREEVLS